MIRFGKRLALAALIIFGLCGCGGGATINPTPILSTMTPEHATAGGPAFQLSLVALNVENNTTVNWNGSARTTTTDPNTGQLVAQILATDIATPGTADVTVVTPSPGGGISNDLTFFIDPPNNPAPTITSLMPPSATLGGGAFALQVNGTGFISSSSVNWNGSPRATTFVSATQLSAAILMSDIATAGSVNVTVTNPSPGGGTSGISVFTINGPVAAAAAGAASIFRLVSEGVSGEAANGPSGAPRMDESGRYVAFESLATNLLPSGARASVFVRDTCVAAADCTPQTIAVDVGMDGGAPNAGLGRGLAISPEGRYVAFSSQATNLVAGEFRAGPQIYLRDTCSGVDAAEQCLPSTVLISIARNRMPGDAASEFPSVSANGRYVVFASAASNLVPGVNRGVPQVYMRDTCLGASTLCSPQTVLVSADPAGGPGKAASLQASVSRDGRFVAFDSQAPDLAPETSAGYSNVFLRDTCWGDRTPEGCSPSTALVSVGSQRIAADGASFAPAISADGTYVAFVTRATTIVREDTSSAQKIVVRSTCANAPPNSSCVPATALVSTPGSGGAHAPFISGDGRFVTYVTDNGDFSAGTIRAYLRDTCAGGLAPDGCKPATHLVLGSAVGRAAELAGGRSRFGAPVSLDGEIIALFSTGPVPGLKGNLNGGGDVLVGVLPATQ